MAAHLVSPLYELHSDQLAGGTVPHELRHPKVAATDIFELRNRHRSDVRQWVGSLPVDPAALHVKAAALASGEATLPMLRCFTRRCRKSTRACHEKTRSLRWQCCAGSIRPASLLRHGTLRSPAHSLDAAHPSLHAARDPRQHGLTTQQGAASDIVRTGRLSCSLMCCCDLPDDRRWPDALPCAERSPESQRLGPQTLTLVTDAEFSCEHCSAEAGQLPLDVASLPSSLLLIRAGQ